MFPELSLWYAACAAIAAILSRSIGRFVLRHAEKLKLVQTANHRSSHSAPTPAGGGIGIADGATLALLLLAMALPSPLLWPVCGLSLLIAAVGLIDDIRNLPARARLSAQALALGALVWSVQPASFLPVPDALWLLLLLLAGMWWVNLFNFMDGIDGIAGSQAVFMLVSAAALSLLQNPDAPHYAHWWWMLIVAAATLGFLTHNWPPARLFMGDVGSTYLAFMIFALALFSTRAGWLNYPAWLILGASFIADASVTLVRRFLAGERWFEAHRSHAYQHLARRFSHRRATLAYLIINAGWLAPMAALSLKTAPGWDWLLAAIAYAPLCLAALACRAGKA